MPEVKSVVHGVHVGYIADNLVVDGLQARGWRLAHNLPGVVEFRKQNERGAWTLSQHGIEWFNDFQAVEEEIKNGRKSYKVNNDKS